MNLIELSEKFPLGSDAIEYFEEIRWGGEPKCAYCDEVNITEFVFKYNYREDDGEMFELLIENSMKEA